MPVIDGIGATAEIKADHPEVEVIALTSFVEEERVTAAIEAGASGFLLKDAEADDLAAAVRGATAARSTSIRPGRRASMRDRRTCANDSPATGRPSPREPSSRPANARSSRWSPAGPPTRRSPRCSGSPNGPPGPTSRTSSRKLGLTSRTQAALFASSTSWPDGAGRPTTRARALRAPTATSCWRDRSTAPAIVFVHGTRMSRGCGATQMAAPVRRVPHDRRRSARPRRAGDVPFTLRGAADRLAEVIDREAGGRAVVVGLSLGGFVAMDLAARSPERVRGLVIAGATVEPIGLGRVAILVLAWVSHLRQADADRRQRVVLPGPVRAGHRGADHRGRVLRARRRGGSAVDRRGEVRPPTGRLSGSDADPGGLARPAAADDGNGPSCAPPAMAGWSGSRARRTSRTSTVRPPSATPSGASPAPWARPTGDLLRPGPGRLRRADRGLAVY